MVLHGSTYGAVCTSLFLFWWVGCGLGGEERHDGWLMFDQLAPHMLYSPILGSHTHTVALLPMLEYICRYQGKQGSWCRPGLGDILVKIQDINKRGLGEWSLLIVLIPPAPLPLSTTVDFKAPSQLLQPGWRSRRPVLAQHRKTPLAPSAVATASTQLNVLGLETFLFTLGMK